MAFSPDLLLAHDFGETRQCYEPRDAIIYALGLGLGHDPLDAADLAFLDETHLSVLPSFAVTLCSPGMWIRDPAFGVNFARLVHTAQEARFHKRLPPCAEVSGSGKVSAIFDRGEGRGAVVELERQICDTNGGGLYCTLKQSLLLRDNGGFGGQPPSRATRLVPETPPELEVNVEVSSRAALIYRLSGDRNPLHIDPNFARSAGFDRPIMHGLGSYGMAGAAVSRALAIDPADMSYLSCRFSGIVTPGDHLKILIWPAANRARFRAMVGDRVVLDDGSIEWNVIE